MKVFIIGGGTSCYYLVEELLESNKNVQISILTQESFLPYNRMLLPRFLAREIPPEKLFFKDLNWYESYNIKIYKNLQIRQINDEIEVTPFFGSQEDENLIPKNFLIKTEDRSLNKETIAKKLLNQDSLVFWATSYPTLIPNLYTGIDRVLTWRTIQDTQKIQEILKSKAKVAIIGGSYIGMELAMAAEKYQTDYTWLIRSDGFLHPGLDTLIQKQLIENWSGFSSKPPMFTTEIQEISYKNNALEAKLSNNKTELFDYILLGTGLDRSQNSFSGIKKANHFFLGDLLEIPFTKDKKIASGSFNQARLGVKIIVKQILNPNFDTSSNMAKLVHTPYQIRFADRNIRVAGVTGDGNYFSQITETAKEIKQIWFDRQQEIGFISVAK